MSLLPFILILGSASLHVTWNMIAKKDHMTMPFYAILCSFGAVAWCHVPFWTPIPISQLPVGFWLCIGGMLCSELCYSFGLITTYSKLDMVTAYPMIRAIPIILTAVFTTVTGIGKALTLQAYAGFFIVFCGALLMPLKSRSEISFKSYWNPAMLLVLLTACGTSGYTIFDSMAQKYVRTLGTGQPAPVISLTYYSLRAFCLASTMWIAALSMKSGRASLRQLWHERNWHPIAAGFCGSMTYVLVLIAMNFVDNVSYVQVFRQLGLPLGMCAGVFILKEKSYVIKWVGMTLILTGLAVSIL